MVKCGIGEEYVNNLGCSTKSYPKDDYVGLKMSLQSEWKYPHKAILEFRYFMASVDRGMKEDVMTVFVGE